MYTPHTLIFWYRNLRFLESPFSLYIKLRKKFATQPQVKLQERQDFKVDPNHDLKLARDTINILEEKLAQTESEFVKVKVEGQKRRIFRRNKTCQRVIEKISEWSQWKNKVISELKKCVKAKDKEIYYVEKDWNITKDNKKQLKDKIADIKRDQSETARTIKSSVKQGKLDKEKLEQKVKALEKKINSDEYNNNNTTTKLVNTSPSASVVTASTVLHTSTLATPPSSNFITSPATSLLHAPRSSPTILASTVYSHLETGASSSTVSQPSSLNITCPALSFPTPHSSTPNPRPISPHTTPGTSPPRPISAKFGRG